MATWMEDKQLDTARLWAAGAGAAAAVAEVTAHSPSLSGAPALGAAAHVLGLSVDGLTDRLWAGEDLARLAAAAGVSLAALEAAVNAATRAATRAAIAHGAATGQLTRAHARWLAEGLAAGYWGAGDGFGLGAPQPES